MKRINYKRIAILIGLGLGLLWLGRYAADSKTYSLEEMSAFIASCGTFIQSSYSDAKPGQWDYFIVFVSAIIVLASLYYSIKYLIRPERQTSHIKYQILDEKES